MPILYAAEPIDQREGPVSVVFSEILWHIGQTCGVHIYRPARGWQAGDCPPDPRIEETNRYILDRADIVVAHLPVKVATIGVPREIEYATRTRGIPVLVVTNITRSQSLADLPTYRPGDKHEIAQAVKQALEAPRRDIQRWVDQQIDVKIEPIDPLLVVLTPDGAPPSRTYPDDAGIDLITAEPEDNIPIIIYPGKFQDIHTTVDAVQLPPGVWGMITGRSSTLRKRGLHVPVAVIDPGWRGPLYVGVWNLGRLPVEIKPGERLGQLLLLPNLAPNHPILATDEIEPHDRGLKGFGSSGE